MTSLTWEEKMASFSILNMIMKADNVILQAELDYLSSAYNRLGMTTDDIDKLDIFDYDHSKTIVSCMTVEKKELIKQMFNEMAVSDDHLDPREAKLIESIFE